MADLDEFGEYVQQSVEELLDEARQRATAQAAG
jgi:hypothetical protein